MLAFSPYLIVRSRADLAGSVDAGGTWPRATSRPGERQTSFDLELRRPTDATTAVAASSSLLAVRTSNGCAFV